MGKIYKKIILGNEHDIKKATRSIYNNCRNLKRARCVKDIFSEVTLNGELFIVRTLLHCQSLVRNSIIITDNVKFFEGYKKNSDQLISAIENNYSTGNEKQEYKPIPSKLITNFIRYHTKSFKILSQYKLHKHFSVMVNPDNEEWKNAMFTAIAIWPNSEFSE